MFMNHAQITPVRLSAILEAAEAAARAIPPAFPLDATVAVNPFLGQTHEDLASAAARLARVAGVRVTRSGADYAAAIRDGRISEDDLAEALATAASPLKPADTAALRSAAERLGDGPQPAALPTIADLAAQATGIDWPALIDKCIGLWAAGQFDRGQALWSPAPGAEAFAAWRAWAMHDLTPEIAGLNGFCAHVDLAAFRRLFAFALAGADRLDEPLRALVGQLGTQVDDDVLAPYLALVIAAATGAAMPDEEELGRLYGSASPSRVRRLLAHLERLGLIVVREDFGGERSITVPGIAEMLDQQTRIALAS